MLIKLYSRRQFLQWGGVGGAVLVAGCACDETDTTEDEDDTHSVDSTETDQQSSVSTSPPAETDTESGPDLDSERQTE